MINIYAPIIPYQEAGGIQLYSTWNEVEPMLKGSNYTCRSFGRCSMECTVSDSLCLYFLKEEGILYKITTLPPYKGKLFGTIGTETTEEEFLKIEPSFVYDEFEEVFESPKGVFIETDAIEHTAWWISIFIRELLAEGFWI